MPSPTKKQWSLLTYIAGDNDLSNAGLDDINEMTMIGSSNDIHVGVEIDTYGEHTGSIRYEITPPDWSGVSHRTVIDRLIEQDSGSVYTFTNFARWALQRFPAQNTVMVVWNHGAGFKTHARDIGYDDFGTSLSMPDIADALTRAGVTASNKIQILGFDACLMNMLEVVDHFSEHAEFIVGSQQLEPYDGWEYQDVLRKMHSLPTPTSLAIQMVDSYVDHYRRIGEENITQSAIDLSRTGSLVDELGTLGSMLVSNLGTLLNDIKESRKKAQSYDYPDYMDLADFLSHLLSQTTDPGIQTQIQKVLSMITACVIREGHFGHQVQNSNGLSIWFPTYKELYLANRAKYIKLKCNARSWGWTEMLDAIYW